MANPGPEFPTDPPAESGRVRSRVSTDLATVFTALASTRRLALLETLSVAGGPLSMSEATERVPRRERELGPDGDSEPTPREVRLTLRHVHLGKLRAAGLVAFDEATDTLSLTVDPDRLVELVDAAVDLGGD
jgi:hypothetical protein